MDYALAISIDLPPGWEAKLVNGKPLYINHNAQTSQWEDPVTGRRPGARVEAPHGTDYPLLPPKSEPRSESYARNSEHASSIHLGSSSGRPEKPSIIEAATESRPAERTDTLRSDSSMSTASGFSQSEAGPGVRAPSSGRRAHLVEKGSKFTKWVKRKAYGASSSASPPTIAQEDTPAASNSRERATAATADGGGIGSCPSYDDITKPLPPGWNAHNTVKGHVFYTNHASKTTTGTRPVACQAPPPPPPPVQHVPEQSTAPEDISAESDSNKGAPATPDTVGATGGGGGIEGCPSDDDIKQPLPPGWSRRKTEARRVYYINHVGKTITWTRPVTRPAAPSPPPPVAHVPEPPASGQRESATIAADAAADEDPPLPKESTAPEDTSAALDSHEYASAAPDTVEATDGCGGGIEGCPSNDDITQPLPPAPASGQRESATIAADAADDEDPPLPKESTTPKDISAALDSHEDAPAAPDTVKATDGCGGGIEGCPSDDDITQPLPPGWSLSKTEEGHVFYINHVSKTTTWTRPVTRPAPPSPASPVAHVSEQSTSSEAIWSPLDSHQDAPAAPDTFEATDGGGGGGGGIEGRPSHDDITQPLPPESTAPEDIRAPLDSHEDAPAALDTVEATDGGGGGGDIESCPSDDDITQPLPPGWSLDKTEEGHVFYINHVNKTTTWTRPVTFQAPPPRPPPVAHVPKPPARKQQESPTIDADEDPPLPEASRQQDRPVTIVATTTVAAAADKGSPLAAPASRQEGVNAAGGEEPSLPEGWSSRVSNKGKVFFVNIVDQKSTWIRPVAPQAAPAVPRPQASLEPPASCQQKSLAATTDKELPLPEAPASGQAGTDAEADEEPLLPEGWSSRVSKIGKVSNANVAGKRPTWIRPVAPQAAPVVPPPHSSLSPPASRQKGTSFADDEESPLPKGSSCRTSKKRKKFYVGPVGKSTTWIKPVDPQAVPSMSLPHRGAPTRRSSHTSITGKLNDPNLINTSTTRVKPVTPQAEPPMPLQKAGVPASPASHQEEDNAVPVCEEQLLHEGWSSRMSKKGKMYCVLANNTTTWTRPMTSQAGPPKTHLNVNPSSHQNGNTATADEELPLPEDWIACMSKAGNIFYGNLVDGTTTWIRPTAPQAARSMPLPQEGVQDAPASNQGGSAAPAEEELPLPEGWSRRTTTRGEVYYANDADKTTTWTRPTTPRAAPSMSLPQARVPAPAARHPDDPSTSAPVGGTAGPEQPPLATSVNPITHPEADDVLPSQEACCARGRLGEPLPSPREVHVQQTEIAAATGCIPLPQQQQRHQSPARSRDKSLSPDEAQDPLCTDMPSRHSHAPAHGGGQHRMHSDHPPPPLLSSSTISQTGSPTPYTQGTEKTAFCDNSLSAGVPTGGGRSGNSGDNHNEKNPEKNQQGKEREEGKKNQDESENAEILHELNTSDFSSDSDIISLYSCPNSDEGGGITISITMADEVDRLDEQGPGERKTNLCLKETTQKEEPEHEMEKGLEHDADNEPEGGLKEDPPENEPGEEDVKKEPEEELREDSAGDISEDKEPEEEEPKEKEPRENPEEELRGEPEEDKLEKQPDEFEPEDEEPDGEEPDD